MDTQKTPKTHTPVDSQAQLARRIGLPLLTFYGLGTILGAGIYVLVGKVAAASGLLTPLAFLVAATVAGITALSYCQLVIKFPRSAGEANYVEHGFHIPKLTQLVGYLVVFTGIVSSATLANGFVGYLTSFININPTLALCGVIILMGGIALWGIAESLWLAAVITLIELSGLALVIFYGSNTFIELPNQLPNLFVPTSSIEIGLILGGAFLAFYAFIGFEDMVNIVEEVKEPTRTMPQAIILAVIVSTLIYVLVAIVAVLGMPIEQLAHSGAPLKELVATQNTNAAQWIGIISLFAIVNGVLTQIIMASRVLYGMAGQQRAPLILRKVSNVTHTPWVATGFVVVLILGFALWLPLVVLAKTTSFIILVIFSLINIALWKMKKEGQFDEIDTLPNWPILGAVLSIGLLSYQVWQILI